MDASPTDLVFVITSAYASYIGLPPLAAKHVSFSEKSRPFDGWTENRVAFRARRSSMELDGGALSGLDSLRQSRRSLDAKVSEGRQESVDWYFASCGSVVCRGRVLERPRLATWLDPGAAQALGIVGMLCASRAGPPRALPSVS